MNVVFLCSVIIQFFFYNIQARYNKDVVCVIDKNKAPVCEVVSNARRNDLLKNNNIPSHDPYIPRANTVFYNCSSSECSAIELYSMTQVTSPDLMLKSCYLQAGTYQCDKIRYNYFKNVDKLVFLSNNIKNKEFYLVDCLVYSDRGRVCHKKDSENVHAKLVDTGTIVRPKESNVLSQDEFLCEEGAEGQINCDLNPFVPFNEGLRIKQLVEVKGDILLKTGNYVVTLTKNCIDNWCGFSGFLKGNSRREFSRYEPPGGWVYQCYYAKKQQICLPLYNKAKKEYDHRDYLNT